MLQRAEAGLVCDDVSLCPWDGSYDVCKMWSVMLLWLSLSLPPFFAGIWTLLQNAFIAGAIEPVPVCEMEGEIHIPCAI